MTDVRGPDGMRPLRRPFHEGDDFQHAAEGAGTQFALGPVGACSRCGCHVRTPARISEDLWSVTLSRPSRRVMNELLLRVVGELRGLCWTCAGTREALQTARHLNREVQSDPSTSSEEAE